MSSRRRQVLYLLLAVAGVVLTWYHNIQFMMMPDATPFNFFTVAMANPAASSLTLDVTIAALTFVVWMWHEAGRLGMSGRWLYTLLTFFVAVAFAFPLFLFMRERHLQTTGNSGGNNGS
jgi:hypothetical protein